MNTPPRQIGEFPDWESRYQRDPIEKLPWYTVEPDGDLLATLSTRAIRKGHFLDLGTGPGTQAVWLARQGFQVTGSDLSQTALDAARHYAHDAGVEVTWVIDDILNTTLNGPFDWIFDRGCFHVLPPERRADYVATLHRLLAPGGLLLLKTFHVLETAMEGGPYRFDDATIDQLFSGHFQRLESRASRFEGAIEQQPVALFTLLAPRQPCS
ncbi:MAG: class I SAM-dependent methyltransferase [Magnetococcales bacterium]|nr:class I SAM-dependent methyltransferase [Magnetococcales bacterium]